MCSKKWAKPGTLSGSLRCPTRTSIAAAALSVVGSEIRRTVRLFGRTMILYSRSSCGLDSISIGGVGEMGEVLVEISWSLLLMESMVFRSRFREWSDIFYCKTLIDCSKKFLLLWWWFLAFVNDSSFVHTCDCSLRLASLRACDESWPSEINKPKRI